MINIGDKDNLKGVESEWNTDRWRNIYFYKKPEIVKKIGDSGGKKSRKKKGQREKSPAKESEKKRITYKKKGWRQIIQKEKHQN